MSRRHLGCVACRIRLHATAPEIELLEGMCPVCGARLKLASSTSALMGFRLFDLGLLSDEESGKQGDVLGCSVDPVARVRDDWGDWFGNDNSNLLWNYPLPEHYLRRNPASAPGRSNVLVPSG